MTRNDDPWGTGPDDWEPSASAARGAGRAPRRRVHGGLVLLAATGIAVLVATSLGVGAAFGWFGGAAPVPSAATPTAEQAPPPVDDGEVEDQTPPTPLAVPAPTPAPLGDEPASELAADAAVNAVVAAGTEIAQRADGDTAGLENIATGFVQGELQSLALERSQLGYKQTGEAKVLSVTTRDIDLAATPPSITLDVCIDTSGIDVLDENGVSQKSRMYDPGFPTLHSYGAQYVDGLWKIATHEIPDSAPCA